MENQISKVVIEVCQGCRSHQWNTRHDEAKYNHFYAMMSEELKMNVSENIIVYKNMVPAEYMELDQYTGLAAVDKKKKIIRMQPRLGAFEVFYKNFCLYSKLRSGMWPRVGLVAKKMKTLVYRLKNNEDVTSLFTQSPEQRTKSPTQSLTRAQTASALRRPTSGGSVRSKFVTTYSQAFLHQSPQKSIKEYSPVRTSRSKLSKTDRIQLRSLSPGGKDQEEESKEEHLSQSNPFELQASSNARTLEKDAPRPRSGFPYDQSTEDGSRRGSRVVTPVSINVIASEDQELLLFGSGGSQKLRSQHRPIQAVRHTEEQIPQESGNRSQNSSIPLERDVFDQEVKKDPPVPGSTLENLKNAVQEGDMQGGYLSDVNTEDNEQDHDVPQLEVSESGKQPLYYFGDSGPGGMPVLQKIELPDQQANKKQKGYHSSESDSDDQNYG